MKTRREKIEATIGDLVSSFLYYDRKEDEGLPRGAIEEAIEAGEITKDEIVELFEDALFESARRRVMSPYRVAALTRPRKLHPMRHWLRRVRRRLCLWWFGPRWIQCETPCRCGDVLCGAHKALRSKASCVAGIWICNRCSRRGWRID